MKQKNKTFENLKIFYVLVFALGTLIIAPTHIFPQPYFMYARFPHYLEKMGPFLGFSWPTTFEIYHYALYVLAVIISLNALGIVFYKKIKKLAIFSSAIGAFVFLLVALFFFFVFINVNISTAIVFGLYSVTLLTLDLFTFKALIK